MSQEKVQKGVPDWTRITFPCDIRTTYKNQVFTGILIAPNLIRTQEDGNTVEVTMNTFVHIPRKGITKNAPNAWDSIEYKSGNTWKYIDDIRIPINEQSSTSKNMLAPAPTQVISEPVQDTTQQKRIPDWSKITFPSEIRVRRMDETNTGTLINANEVQIQNDGQIQTITLYTFARMLRKKAKERGDIKTDSVNIWDVIEYKSDNEWRWLDEIRKNTETLANEIIESVPFVDSKQEVKKPQSDVVPKQQAKKPKSDVVPKQEVKKPKSDSLHEEEMKKPKSAMVPEEDMKKPKSAMLPEEEMKKPQLVVEKEKKYKKETIPKNVRDLCWYTWIGNNIASAKCVCCERIEIRMNNFECGHVIAESKGGTISVENLRPICSACNKSMGSENLADFKRRCGFGSLLVVPPPINDPSPIKVPQPDNNTEPLSRRRRELPPQIQRRVWNEHIGKDVANAKCTCCKEENINYNSFFVGFVKDSHEGGTLLTDNLRPICSSCDSSIGTMSINEYAYTYFGWRIQ